MKCDQPIPESECKNCKGAKIQCCTTQELQGRDRVRFQGLEVLLMSRRKLHMSKLESAEKGEEDTYLGIWPEIDNFSSRTGLLMKPEEPQKVGRTEPNVDNAEEDRMCDREDSQPLQEDPMEGTKKDGTNTFFRSAGARDSKQPFKPPSFRYSPHVSVAAYTERTSITNSAVYSNQAEIPSHREWTLLVDVPFLSSNSSYLKIRTLS